jgi:hypothetical protein
MIGHYLLTLTAGEARRVHLRALAPGQTKAEYLGGRSGVYSHADGTACLVGAVLDSRFTDQRAFRPTRLVTAWPWWNDGPCRSRISVEQSFDALCHRFGEARIGRVIRDRLLANELRQLPAPAQPVVAA